VAYLRQIDSPEMLVRISSPGAGSTFAAPATMTISADASDRDGTISKVEFYNGSSLLGSDAISPYTFTWSNVSAGAYTLSAKATDNSGTVAVSSTVGVTVTNIAVSQAPSITTQPANRSVTTGQTASFSVVVSGTAPLAMQWQKNNVTISGATGTSYTTPATTIVDSGATYRVIVTNLAGSVTSSSATLTVSEQTAQQPPIGAGTGLTGQYFDNINFTGTNISRTDSSVNFNWGLGSPSAGIGPDTFSVRWAGQVQSQYSQTYTFFVSGDDGVRLWVNDQLLVNKWILQSTTEWSGSIALTAGTKYAIRLEYFENGGDAVAQLRWSSASTPKAIIPTSQLYVMTNTQRIEQLFLDIHGRASDPSGLAYWVGQLDSGVSLTTIRGQFVISPECTANINKLYMTAYGRNATSTELATQRAFLNNGGTLAGIRLVAVPSGTG